MFLISEGNHGVTRTLDSNANISVSRSEGEVVAAAVQIKKLDIRLIVASNDTLPQSTITYLEEILNISKQLSEDYLEYNCVPANPASPRKPFTKDLSKAALMRVQNLWQKILRFGRQTTATSFET